MAMTGDAMPVPVRAYPGNPLVSIIIPCFNEVDYIAACVSSLVGGEFPSDRLEVLIVDGMSNDGTRDVLVSLQQKYECVRVVDNPARIKPIAFNTGIEHAKGEVAMIVGAHATYPPNYVSCLVRYLMTYDVVNVGGVMRARARSGKLVAKVFSQLLTHSFGVGNARHYTGVEVPTYTDIALYYCAPRELFITMGGFKEALLRGQDREFSLRVAKSGRRMMTVPETGPNYLVRDSVKGFFSWAFEAGVTPIRINRLSEVSTISPRNLVPPLFVFGLLMSLALAAIWPGFIYLFYATLGSYAFVAIVASAQISWREKSPALLCIMPFAFIAWHSLYGIGSIVGFLEPLWRPGKVRR